MRLIRARENYDCGVACTAMLAGVPYDEARRAVFGTRKGDRRTQIRDLRAGLAQFGLCLARRSVSLAGRKIETIKSDALVKTNVRSNGDWHWVVWDERRKRVLDPSRPPYRRLRPHSYVTFCWTSQCPTLERDGTKFAAPVQDQTDLCKNPAQAL
jgi:hypothetical protein